MEMCLVSYVKEAPDGKSTQNPGIRTHHCPKQLQGTQDVRNDLTEGESKQPYNPCKAEKGKKIKKCKKEKKANFGLCMNDPHSGRSSAFDPYQTTFMRDFAYRPGSVTEPIRPKSSNGYTYPYQLHEPIGDSSYSNDYAWKLITSQQPLQCSTGSRRNEPHPCDVLWLWKQLKKNPESFPRVSSYFPHPMSSDDISRVKAHQYDTIYRQDYLGLQQEFKCPPCVSIQRMGQPCPPPTENRYHYRKPNQKPELAVCASRYGSNKQWKTAAKGIVPRLTQAHMKNQDSSKHPTTYEREYGSAGMDITSILKSLEPKAIKNYLESLPSKEREVLLQLLSSMTPGSEVN
ncbi:testis-expressed protein 26-like isoform X2 [Pristis pectinata]|uniref:testis-expressed protein 26-like isoform X2 n=1 Tax=Pristis pectinata TaxID=685728 RepID=UPI00223CC2B4|nr:testis-expressed protein 26-like isoform X2 [Pristis pectinata]